MATTIGARTVEQRRLPRLRRRHPFMFASVLPAGLRALAPFNLPHWGNRRISSATQRCSKR